MMCAITVRRIKSKLRSTAFSALASMLVSSSCRTLSPARNTRRFSRPVAMLIVGNPRLLWPRLPRQAVMRAIAVLVRRRRALPLAILLCWSRRRYASAPTGAAPIGGEINSTPANQLQPGPLPEWRRWS